MILQINRYFFLTIGSILFVSYLNAQNKVKEMPSKYVQPVEGIKLSPSKESSGNVWVVFSDRNNNFTYDSHKARKVKNSNIGFLELFYVLEEKGDFLKICKDPNLNRYTGELSRDAKSFGWINKNK